jgi:farnesyl diphosphate synthase
MPEVPDSDRLAMVSTLAHASGRRMCGGQALDLEAEGHQVDLQALERIRSLQNRRADMRRVRMGALSAGNAVVRPCRRSIAMRAISSRLPVQDDILTWWGYCDPWQRQGGTSTSSKGSTILRFGTEQCSARPD